MWFVPLFCVSCVFGVSTNAWAQRKPVSVALGEVKGPSFTRVRAAVSIAINRQSAVQMVTKNADATIVGSVRKLSRGRLEATLEVVDRSRAVRAVTQMTGSDDRELATQIKRRLWEDLGKAILAAKKRRTPPRRVSARTGRAFRQRSRPPGKSIETSPPRSTRPLAVANARSKRSSGLSSQSEVVGPLAQDIFRFGIGFGLYARDWSWNDEPRQELAGYSLGSAPAFRGHVLWFPGGHISEGPISWLGLDLEAELPFAVSSEREGVEFPTAASSWRVGLLARLPVDKIEAQLGVGFAERRFALEASDEGEEVPDLPGVRYQVLTTRLAVLARVVERVDLRAVFGWGFMLDSGPVGRAPWFPNGSSYTVGVGGAVTVYLAGGLGIFGQFDWQGAFFDFDSSPDDQRIAGGASDNYYLGSLGVSFAAGR